MRFIYCNVVRKYRLQVMRLEILEKACLKIFSLAKAFEINFTCDRAQFISNGTRCCLAVYFSSIMGNGKSLLMAAAIAGKM